MTTTDTSARSRSRERFLKTMRFEPVDHPPIMAPSPWPLTLKRWHEEGLPRDTDLYEYFQLEPLRTTPVKIETLLYPPVKPKTLQEGDQFDIAIDKRGVKVRSFKDGRSMPEFLEYPIKGPESLPWLQQVLDPSAPGRVAPDWLAQARAARARGGLLLCNGGMYFAFLNERMGTEKLMCTYFDAPQFVHQTNDLLCRLCESALTTCLEQFQLDCVAYHEDMAYKNGSIISPAMFREFMTPYYRRIAAISAQHNVDLHWMDSDGDISELIPLWLDGGINIFYPCEVAAGMDVAKLRSDYGTAIGLIGGFDKRILASDPPSIRAELKRLRPVIEAGGYIPNCDHSVPPDVSFANICCFVKTLKSMYGIR